MEEPAEVVLMQSWIGKKVVIVTKYAEQFYGTLCVFLRGDQGYYVLKLEDGSYLAVMSSTVKHCYYRPDQQYKEIEKK